MAGKILCAVLTTQSSMAFKLPSFGLFERTKRSQSLDDFPLFLWSDPADKEARKFWMCVHCKTK